GLGRLKTNGEYEIIKRDTTKRENTIPSNEIHSIAIDRSGNFIICANGGFAFVDPLKRTFKTFINDSVLKSISRNATFGAMEDTDSNWWLAQSNGLFHYNTSTKKLTKIPISDSIEQQIHTVAEDSSGNIYAGGLSGMIIISKKSLKPVAHLLKKDGLPSDNVMGLLCDKNGSIWILGNTGVARYTNSTKELQTFDARDGVVQGNHNLANIYMARDGAVFIGSSEGFNRFNPDSIKVEKKSLRVFVTTIELPGGISGLPEYHNANFAHDENNVSFSFLAVDFQLGASIQYRYQLVGFDTSFVYPGKERTTRYTNLPPGKYSFKVEASVNNKDWYASTQEVSFIIARAFWKTWWFRLLLGLLIVGILFAYFKLRVAQINKEARLRTDYEIKLNELENSALRTQMNPHFIFNSLNTINSFINSNDRVQANQYISKFSRLVRLILDHSREKKIVLKDELEVATLYMQLEQIRFENKFRYEINLVDIDSCITEVPPLIIQPFVENSILHGLLPLDSEGVLKLLVTREGDSLKCIIEDNGIGREAARVIRKKSGYDRKSHGMDITLKRISFFNKEYGMNSEVSITDIIDEHGKVRGTRVEIPLVYLETF
ncbi:MAG: histidine kinase, partial [Chitinophagaceae bacterium]|nr:histidine kinase [Chitinophagaceae bacterium]